MSLATAPAPLFVQQFSTNIQLLLQQKGSRLRSCVMSGSHYGKQASPVEQVSPVEMQAVTSRYQPMGRIDAQVDRRWVIPSDYDLPQLVDDFDKLKMLLDPTSSFALSAVHAAGRQIDRTILAAIQGTNYTGEKATDSTILPSGQKVAVNFGSSADVGLTVAKLREAKRILMANNVDMNSEEFYCIVKSKQHDNLLAEAQVISSDFNPQAVLVEGRVTRFLGFNIIHTELLPADGTDTDADAVFCFAKSGVYLGLWKDIETSVAPRYDLQGIPWQVYVKLSMGATRLEEKKVVQILCE